MSQGRSGGYLFEEVTVPGYIILGFMIYPFLQVFTYIILDLWSSFCCRKHQVLHMILDL